MERYRQATETRKKRKFVAIAKAENSNFVKYRFNDLNKFIEFIVKKHNPFFFNVFSNTGINKGLLMYTWGRKKGLEPAN